MARAEHIQLATTSQYAPSASSAKSARRSSGSSSVSDGRALDSQTRTRRLFSFLPLFCFSLTYMSVWEGTTQMMYFALYNGGPTTFLFSFVVAFCGALCQAASLGEMASLEPIAGAQYHWTYHLAPLRVRRFAAWIQAWSTWFGYLSLLAGVANVTIIQLESTIQLNHEAYVPGGWHTSVLVIAMIVPFGLINMYAFKLVPLIELMTGVLHVCLFVVFVVVFAVYGHGNSAEFIFLRSNVSSGWSNTYVSWNIGMLSCVWSFTGFDSVVHMSEEARSAKSAVPRAMFWSILANGILAFVMLIMILRAMGPIEDALDAASPIITILLDITGSRAATTALSSGLVVICFNVNLTNIASASRLTWAWARDGGLPAYFAYVHPRHRVPQRAIVLSMLIVSALCLLNIGSGAYVAFGAIAALGSLALYLSYAIAIASILSSRLRNPKLKLGEWNLGRYGVFVNSFALMYTFVV
ncbi:putative amino acid permease protein [Eutypa lata UCREL1]|uniref:Putative amino acid permease protein n=1 Tax=Eutypa lata (strain UCR-EL1) TaxID=1287681 RepID=M7SLR1_EUTLA|nr:putative amino acid permease protein [Eutypa lata UCREL1]